MAPIAHCTSSITWEAGKDLVIERIHIFVEWGEDGTGDEELAAAHCCC